MMTSAAYRAALALMASAAMSASFVKVPPASAQESGQGGPAFVDERRLPQDGAAAARQRESDEALQRLKTEAEDLRRKLAQEAEARRKFEEEAAAKRSTAEGEAKAAAEADARRKAEEAAAAQRAEAERQAKAAAEADARRKAEEAAATQRAEAERQAKAAVDAKAAAETEAKSRAAAAAIAARMAPNQPCSDVETDSKMLPGATVEVSLKSECLAGKKVTLKYGAHGFVYAIPASGEATLYLDLFEGAQPAALVLPNGQRAAIDTSGADVSQISKVAVVWSAPVNLDLHALEYLAVRGGAGHVWSGSPSNREQAGAASRDGAQGRGFMSRIDDGAGEGTKVEVYTFWHKAGQRNGAVTLFIDHASRGETPTGDYCGNGAKARVEAMVVRMRPGGKIENELVRLGPAVCGQKLRDAERFNPDTLSHLLARG